MPRTGLIQVYTGTGKGKTTAAAGLALRAAASGLRVGWISFHKDNPGELRGLRKLGAAVRAFCRKHPLCSKEKIPQSCLRQECLKGWQYAQKILRQGKFDLLVLDEINICVRDGYLREAEVLELMRAKPENMELVLTGRGATPGMQRAADLVSEIKEVKHPFRKNIKARKGIEY